MPILREIPDLEAREIYIRRDVESREQVSCLVSGKKLGRGTPGIIRGYPSTRFDSAFLGSRLGDSANSWDLLGNVLCWQDICWKPVKLGAGSWQ